MRTAERLPCSLVTRTANPLPDLASSFEGLCGEGKLPFEAVWSVPEEESVDLHCQLEHRKDFS